MFITAVMVKVLSNFYVPRWIWIIIIIAIKVINVASSRIVFHGIVPMHTVMNKVTGFLLFLLLFGIGWRLRQASVIVTCSIATFAAIQEGHYIRIGKK